jgi:HSP20 family protein
MIQSWGERMNVKDSHPDVEKRRGMTEPTDVSWHHPMQSFLTSRYIWIHHTHIWRPPTDVYETEHAIRVRAEVAGMENADFSVVLEGRTLRISGVRSTAIEQCTYHQLEIHTGEFLTEVEFVAEVQPESLQAHYQDGFIVVELRKRN